MPGARRAGLQRTGNPPPLPAGRPGALAAPAQGCKASGCAGPGVGCNIQDVGSRGHTHRGPLGPGEPALGDCRSSALLSVGFTFESGAGDLTQEINAHCALTAEPPGGSIFCHASRCHRLA